ncbi:lamin tail domain-containing protein [Candidatus Woesearchaeota archaeon]|nr:lamin tail domain-containing protein [Candidatus Woesearchaeota archaeon]
MGFLFLLLAFLLSIGISDALMINEIMADPVADESLNEWIELYNNESAGINASNWIIGDNNDNDTIEGGLYNKEGTVIPAYGFAIIADGSTRVYNNFNVSSDAVRLYVDDSSIGNGLSNSGEAFYLYDSNGNLVDVKNYNSTTDGLSWAVLNGSLHKSNPTPGFPNDGSAIINEGCDYAVNFILSKTLFDNSSDFTFKIRASKISGTTTNFTMRAKIEDLNGKLVREYEPFTNESITTQKTSSEYTPNLDEGKSYILDSNITTGCDDANIENNFDMQIITIKGKPLDEKSSINIENVLDLGNDKQAKFGQIIRVRLNAYKGNTNKESIAVWIEDNNGNRVSKQSRTGLESKYTNYSLTIPVQIDPNCDGKFDNDDYTIKAEGLDSQDEEEIRIDDLTDSMCDVKIIESKKLAAKGFDFELKDFNEVVDVNKKFSAKIVLDNNNDEDMDIKLWSYVYRGSKSYSGEREENMKEFTLNRNSLQVVELSNMVENMQPGNYKFKVVLNKNGQKTNNEITKDIVVKNNQDENNNPEELEAKEINIDDGIKNKITNNAVNYGIVYESTTEKAKNLILMFLVFLSVVLNIVLIWRR